MLQQYCSSLTAYKRLPTKEVRIGDLLLGNGNPIRIQTMTTTDTMDTAATVAQSIRCIEAGAELVRITAPSKKEAENLLNIKNELRARGYISPEDLDLGPEALQQQVDNLVRRGNGLLFNPDGTRATPEQIEEADKRVAAAKAELARASKGAAPSSVWVREAKERLANNPEAVLIDVREDSEWQKDHATQAVHLGKGILERDLEHMFPDPNRELIMYCGGGYRSVLTAAVAKKMGYQNVASLIGGYKAMVKAQWPMKSGS